ncbi:MAG: TlyA family RNA methyltransferase [bacterium]
MKSNKRRLDLLIVEKGLAESRERARRMILAGEVRDAKGHSLTKAGMLVPDDSPLEVKGDTCRYVSRGGLKLEAALKHFQIAPKGFVCADLGSSTGGFTDCLLQHGAARVFAVDVGKGQLHYRLRQDSRVHLLEQVNARHLTREHLPEPLDLVVCDLSFIGLGKVIPGVVQFLKPSGEILALIKPQFEAGPRQVGKGGIVRDPKIHTRVLENLGEEFPAWELQPQGLIPSPIRGADGNVEFLTLLDPLSQPCEISKSIWSSWVERAVRDAWTANPQTSSIEEGIKLDPDGEGV